MTTRRGVRVSYEAIRPWCLKCGLLFAAEIRRRRSYPRDRRHFDEMHLCIGGRTWYRLRAGEADGMVLDAVLQVRHNQAAAEVLLRRLVERQAPTPRVIVTDTLTSYVPAIKKVCPQAEHRANNGLNNRAAISLQPTRRRERVRRRFKSPAYTQRLLEPFGAIRQHFCPGRHLLAAPDNRTRMAVRRATWDELSEAAA